MLEVRFLPLNRTAWVRGGTRLLDAAEAAGVEILTGCTRGMCGTDPVRIRSGAEALQEPADHERGTLERMGLGPEYRLACSARLVEPGLVGGADGNTGVSEPDAATVPPLVEVDLDTV